MTSKSLAKKSKKPERDAEIVRLFLEERMTTVQIGKRLGMPTSTVSNMLSRRGAHLSPEEKLRRLREKVQMIRSDPEIEARRIEAVRKVRTVWLDCPDERRAEYDKLRASLGSAEARRIIEADIAKNGI